MGCRLKQASPLALDAIWRAGHEYKQAGVTLIDLAPAADVQGGLFNQLTTHARRARMRALDSLNADYGRGTVRFAAMGR